MQYKVISAISLATVALASPIITGGSRICSGDTKQAGLPSSIWLRRVIC